MKKYISILLLALFTFPALGQGTDSIAISVFRQTLQLRQEENVLLRETLTLIRQLEHEGKLLKVLEADNTQSFFIPEIYGQDFAGRFTSHKRIPAESLGKAAASIKNNPQNILDSMQKDPEVGQTLMAINGALKDLKQKQTVPSAPAKRLVDQMESYNIKAPRHAANPDAQRDPQLPADILSLSVPMLALPSSDYKSQMSHMLGENKAAHSFVLAKYDIIKRLDEKIATMDDEQSRFWQQAVQNLEESGWLGEARHPKNSGQRMTPLSRTAENKEIFIKDNLSRKRYPSIDPDGTNPFTLPGLKDADFIFLGEEHTRDLPAQRMIDALIAYNKSVKKERRFTQVFVEVAYQINVAMDFIRDNDGKLPKDALFAQALQYAREQMGERYIESTPHQMTRWLELGYRLMHEAPEVTFYAYDVPGLLAQRNRTAFDYARAAADMPHSRVVFIAGAGHCLRYNVNSIEFAGFEARKSIPSMLSSIVPADKIVSVFMTGGEETDVEQYSNKLPEFKLRNAYTHIFANNLGPMTKEAIAVKTAPQKYGFDYYFHFPDAK